MIFYYVYNVTRYTATGEDGAPVVTLSDVADPNAGAWAAPLLAAIMLLA